MLGGSRCGCWKMDRGRGGTKGASPDWARSGQTVGSLQSLFLDRRTPQLAGLICCADEAERLESRKSEWPQEQLAAWSYFSFLFKSGCSLWNFLRAGLRDAVSKKGSCFRVGLFLDDTAGINIQFYVHLDARREQMARQTRIFSFGKADLLFHFRLSRSKTST